MKSVLILAVVGLVLGKPGPQGFGKPAGGATAGLVPKKKLWLTIDDNSLEVFNPLNPSPAFKPPVAYSKVGGKAVAVPNYFYGSSEELYYNNPSGAFVEDLYHNSPSMPYAKPQLKSLPFKTKGDPNFYYDNSGELNIVPDPSMISQAYSQFYSSLPVQGPNAPRYYIDSSGELGVASDHFITRLVKTDQDPNLYRDNSGELLYVYPKGVRPGSSSANGPPPPPAAAGPAAGAFSPIITAP